MQLSVLQVLQQQMQQQNNTFAAMAEQQHKFTQQLLESHTALAAQLAQNLQQNSQAKYSDKREDESVQMYTKTVPQNSNSANGHPNFQKQEPYMGQRTAYHNVPPHMNQHAQGYNHNYPMYASPYYNNSKYGLHNIQTMTGPPMYPAPVVAPPMYPIPMAGPRMYQTPMTGPHMHQTPMTGPHMYSTPMAGPQKYPTPMADHSKYHATQYTTIPTACKSQSTNQQPLVDSNKSHISNSQTPWAKSKTSEDNSLQTSNRDQLEIKKSSPENIDLDQDSQMTKPRFEIQSTVKNVVQKTFNAVKASLSNAKMTHDEVQSTKTIESSKTPANSDNTSGDKQKIMQTKDVEPDSIRTERLSEKASDTCMSSEEKSTVNETIRITPVQDTAYQASINNSAQQPKNYQAGLSRPYR